MARNPRADQIGMGGRMLSVQVGGSSRNAQAFGARKGVVARIGCQVLTQAFATTTDMLNAA